MSSKQGTYQQRRTSDAHVSLRDFSKLINLELGPLKDNMSKKYYKIVRVEEDGTLASIYVWDNPFFRHAYAPKVWTILRPELARHKQGLLVYSTADTATNITNNMRKWCLDGVQLWECSIGKIVSDRFVHYDSLPTISALVKELGGYADIKLDTDVCSTSKIKLTKRLM